MEVPFRWGSQARRSTSTGDPYRRYDLEAEPPARSRPCATPPRHRHEPMTRAGTLPVNAHELRDDLQARGLSGGDGSQRSRQDLGRCGGAPEVTPAAAGLGVAAPGPGVVRCRCTVTHRDRRNLRCSSQPGATRSTRVGQPQRTYRAEAAIGAPRLPITERARRFSLTQRLPAVSPSPP